MFELQKQTHCIPVKRFVSRKSSPNDFTQNWAHLSSPGNNNSSSAANVPTLLTYVFICRVHLSGAFFVQLTFYDLLLTHGRNKIFDMFYACLRCAARHAVFTKPTAGVGISISRAYNTTNY